MTPLAIWTEMFLKSGQRVLDSMATVAKQARPAARVAVIPTPDAPKRHAPMHKPRSAQKSNGRKRRAKGGRKAKRQAR